MSQGKGSTRRPMFTNVSEFARRWNETFEQHELRLAQDPKEHARRLARSQRLHAPLDGTKFPDQTVSRETSVYKIANNNGQQVGE